jgi:hypothetical protein
MIADIATALKTATRERLNEWLAPTAEAEVPNAER